MWKTGCPDSVTLATEVTYECQLQKDQLPITARVTRVVVDCFKCCQTIFMSSSRTQMKAINTCKLIQANFHSIWKQLFWVSHRKAFHLWRHIAVPWIFGQSSVASANVTEVKFAMVQYQTATWNMNAWEPSRQKYLQTGHRLWFFMWKISCNQPPHKFFLRESFYICNGAFC